MRIQYINRSQIQYMSVVIRNETAKFHVGEHLFRIFGTVKDSEHLLYREGTRHTTL